ncbi:MAG: hypothetical protein SPF56_08430 [Bacteroidaceae bacterium]|nr:hypothetical protein [Bacteroidaceae bacterium]
MRKKELNSIIYAVFVIGIIRGFIELISKTLEVCTGRIGLVDEEYVFIPYEGITLFLLVLNLICMALILVSLFLVLLKKRQGVYLFVFSQILNLLVLGFLDGFAKTSLVYLAGTAIFIALFFAILQLRKDGVSAWKVIMCRQDAKVQEDCNSEKA